MQKSNFRKYTHKIISAIRRLSLMCRHGNVRIFPRSGTPPHVCACACMILTTIWFRWIHVPAEDNKPVNLITSQNHGQCPAHLCGRKMAAWIGARDPCAAHAVFGLAKSSDTAVGQFLTFEKASASSSTCEVLLHCVPMPTWPVVAGYTPWPQGSSIHGQDDSERPWSA